jgi:hypothetical protein
VYLSRYPYLPPIYCISIVPFSHNTQESRIIGISLLTIYPLLRLEKQFSKKFKVLIFLIILIIYHNFIVTHSSFKNVAQSLNSIQEMVKDTSSCIKDNSKVLIFRNPYIHQERLYAYKHALIDKIFKKNNSFILATYGS